MSQRKAPNAWDDDDWEAQADRALKEEVVVDPSAQEPKTKAERLAQHREIQRKIWEAADEPPQLPYHVAATPSVPFAQGFKPKMQLLSRKPVTKTKDPVTGLDRLMIEDDDDEGDQRPQQPSAAELAEKRKQKEREYEERRAKLFAIPPQDTASGASTGPSTPRNMSPPLGGESSRGNNRGRGRGRGGRGGRGGQRNNENRADSRPESQERRQGSNNKNGDSPFRELFDPATGSRPGSRPQRLSGNPSPTPRGPEPAYRTPRGPDDSGRGGFGFANRGAKEG